MVPEASPTPRRQDTVENPKINADTTSTAVIQRHGGRTGAPTIEPFLVVPEGGVTDK